MPTRTVISDSTPELQTLAAELARGGIPPEASKVYVSRNRIYALTLPSGRRVNIKEFHTPAFPNSYISSLLRKSKAERSYLNALKLLAAGISTPRPLAFIETRRHGALKLSYYISEQTDGLHEARQWGLPGDTEAFTSALAGDIAKFWRAGILHRDFTPGNILWQHTPGDGYHFSYVDLNRMAFNVTSRRKLIRLLRALNIDPCETERVTRHFAKEMGFDEQTTVAEALATQRSFIRRKDRLRTIKNKLKHAIGVK